MRDELAELQEVLRADFERTSHPFSRVTVAVFRFGQVAQHTRGLTGKIARRLYRLADLVWVQAIIGAELPLYVACGPGLRLEHGGRGVIINHQTSIGGRAWIYHAATIGARNGDTAPVIGDDAYFGAHSSVLGAITVGDRVKVGAHAAVVKDVVSDVTVVGVPARAIGRGASRSTSP